MQWLAAVNHEPNAGEFTVTQRSGLLIARYLGDDAQVCREGFGLLWSAAVEEKLGETPAIPRIWHT